MPALVAGALLSGFVTRVLYNALAVTGVTFVLGGIVILLVERVRPVPSVRDVDRTPIGKAFAIGVCQAVAIVPGVSRSGATIMGGLAVGLDRAGRGGVLVLPGDSDAHRRVREQIVEGPPRPHERAGLEIAIGF